METTHQVEIGDAGELSDLPDGSVDLIVTSPPYPMIEMWDEAFARFDTAIPSLIDDGDSTEAFERMHDVLDRTWRALDRVVVDGGIVCVNIGDATRSIDGHFQVFPNHAVILDRFRSLSFTPLPDILWRKPVNSVTKFLGSGMLPPNAYATLEHEFILVFRKGEPRSFEVGSDRRYESAYFWEERNTWFSDVWTGLTGARQAIEDAARERTGAFPFEVPYRLINMYSVYDDTVLDPFLGTGTTTVAAMIAGRNSIGYEIEQTFVDELARQIDDVPSLSNAVVRDRIDRHLAFVDRRESNGDPLGYDSSTYSFPVMTRQERDIEFRLVDQVDRFDGGYAVSYRPLESIASQADTATE